MKKVKSFYQINLKNVKLFNQINLINKKAILVLVFVATATIILSGCIGQSRAVKVGDNISVDYIGRTQDGKIFDTSIESVAKENNIYNKNRKYQPLTFVVGKGQMIKGFDENVVGMKVGEKKTLTLPPDEAYGPVDPKLIQTYPIIENIPAKAIIPRILEIPATQFESIFGKNHSVGESINIPESNVNTTIKSMGTNVSLEYNFSVGFKIVQKGAPWNETVLAVNDSNFTVSPDVKMNEVVQLQSVPWNSTVVGINNTNITLRHNAIPDKEIPMLGSSIQVHFNETSIIIDQNNKLAGKTLIFDVTLKSIA